MDMKDFMIQYQFTSVYFLSSSEDKLDVVEGDYVETLAEQLRACMDDALC